MIRLARVGKKKHPTFRIIVSEKTKDTHGDFLELLGSYDPHVKPSKVVVKADRITHWLSKGAQPSGTVHNILIDQNLIKGEKKSVANIKKKEKPVEAPAAPAPAAATPETPQTPVPVVEEKAPEAPAEKPAEAEKPKA